MKCFLISDSHGFHNQIVIPPDIDCIIHSGDSTNYWELYKNQLEADSFIDWFSKLDIKYKVMCGGNHDHYLMKKYNIDKIKDLGIIYNEHGYEEVNGRLFFLSNYTPTFGDWFFMKDRVKISRYWEELIEGIDVLVTHGPCHSLLDSSFDRTGKLECCGDKSLLRKVLQINTKIHTFGHIHSMDGINNYGMRTISEINTIFYNSSMVHDNKFEAGIINKGHIINI